MIVILKACQREIATFPEETRGDLADALARLDAGLVLSMPLSRPMPAIGRGVHELRLKVARDIIASCTRLSGVTQFTCSTPSRRRRRRLRPRT